MTDQRYDPSLLEPGEDEALARDLRLLAHPGMDDELFEHDLRARLLQQAQAIAALTPERTSKMGTATAPRQARPRRLPDVRARLISIASALALVFGGLAGYLHLQAPTPVSAQAILRRTAAALRVAGPDQVVHDVSTVHTVNAPGVNGGISGISANTAPDVTVDRWTQWGANGTIIRDDTAIISGTSTTGTLLQQSVQTGQTTRLYSAQSNTTVVMTATQSEPPKNQVIPDPFDAASLRQFILEAQQGSNHDVRVLPEQTLSDGRKLHVVLVTHTLPVDPQVNAATAIRRYNVTLYVDAHTYAIHKLDLSSVNAKGATLSTSTVLVVKYDTMPVSAVPATVFSLRVPASARAIPKPHAP